jgi:hypothetical protein
LLRQGTHEVQFDAAIDGQPAPKIEIRLRWQGAPLTL